MQVFADESGGILGSRRQSPHRHYTLTAVLIESDEHIATCTNAIVQARIEHNLGHSFEFHFAEITHRQRVVFFEAVSQCPFIYTACSIDHSRCKLPVWTEKPYFYARAIEPIVSNLVLYLRVAQETLGKALAAKVTYDECSDRVFHDILDSQFTGPKDPQGRSLVDKVRPAKSRTSDMIQLADMVCGAVCDHILDGSQQYRQFIRGKEEKVSLVP
jgi:Protein of unknown function (DUF3800)